MLGDTGTTDSTSVNDATGNEVIKTDTEKKED